MRCSVGGPATGGSIGNFVRLCADQRRGNLGVADPFQVNLDFQDTYSKGLERYDIVEILPVRLIFLNQRQLKSGTVKVIYAQASPNSCACLSTMSMAPSA